MAAFHRRLTEFFFLLLLLFVCNSRGKLTQNTVFQTHRNEMKFTICFLSALLLHLQRNIFAKQEAEEEKMLFAKQIDKIDFLLHSNFLLSAQSNNFRGKRQ